MSGFSTSYEVYVLQRGRWELHAQHPSTGREAAVEEAKELLGLPSVTSVRVMRDVYNEHEGVSSEFVIYTGGNGADAPGDDDVKPVARPRGTEERAGRTEEISEPRAASRPRKAAAKSQPRPKPKKSGGNLIVKLSVIAIVSLIIGGLFTWLAIFAFEELPGLRRWAGRDNIEDIIVLVFLLAFLISFAWSAYAFVRSEDLRAKPISRSFESKAKKFERTEKKKWKRTLDTDDPRRRQRAALSNVAERRAAEESKSRRPSKQKPEKVEAKPDLAKEVKQKEAAQEEKVPRTNSSLSPQAEQQKKLLMDFLRSGLEDVAKRRPQLDSFNKFGVNLFLAGACETIGLAGRLNAHEISQILNDGVRILGTKPDQAQRFADSYDSYLVDPKYLGMIEAGRTAMQKQMANQPDAATELASALDGWNRPKSDEPKATGTIAVMFTDIVGSTQMTQTHGDAAAQDVVRTHNRIVRAALTMFEGREVKHTGDGIMASFNNTANGVEAGIYIQKQVAVSNAANPNVPLGIKIGINAGEPIVEDNDLFGTTVQLSARIVDKASSGQVLVSDTVRGICQGKGITFANRGAREMKGFADPIILYEAVWDGDAN